MSKLQFPPDSDELAVTSMSQYVNAQICIFEQIVGDELDLMNDFGLRATLIS